jgi:predicted ester cyclase
VIHHIVRKYYACFNDRRFADAADLLAVDVELDYPGAGATRGRDAYLQFAKRWVRAFPDLSFSIIDIEDRGDTISEVRLTLTGCHEGALDLGVAGTFEPMGARMRLEATELLEVRVERITFARLTLSVADLLAQVSAGPATLT